LIEIFSDEVLNFLMESAAELELIVTGDFDALHDVAGVDVDDWGDLCGNYGADQ
jgi:hypothetical protein